MVVLNHFKILERECELFCPLGRVALHARRVHSAVQALRGPDKPLLPGVRNHYGVHHSRHAGVLLQYRSVTLKQEAESLCQSEKKSAVWVRKKENECIHLYIYYNAVLLVMMCHNEHWNPNMQLEFLLLLIAWLFFFFVKNKIAL